MYGCLFLDLLCGFDNADKAITVFNSVAPLLLNLSQMPWINVCELSVLQKDGKRSIPFLFGFYTHNNLTSMLYSASSVRI